MTITSHGVVDTVLSHYADALGDSAKVYRGHVLRGLTFQSMMLGHDAPDHAALSWAVHDLGIWTDHTFDYLPPSAALVRELAPELGITDPAEVAQAEQMVLDHHGLRPRQDELVETFRRADLADASGGFLHPGLTRAQIKETVRALPYNGFHRQIYAGLFGHAVRHPTRPFPIIKW